MAIRTTPINILHFSDWCNKWNFGKYKLHDSNVFSSQGFFCYSVQHLKMKIGKLIQNLKLAFRFAGLDLFNGFKLASKKMKFYSFCVFFLFIFLLTEVFWCFIKTKEINQFKFQFGVVQIAIAVLLFEMTTLMRNFGNFEKIFDWIKDRHSQRSDAFVQLLSKDRFEKLLITLKKWMRYVKYSSKVSRTSLISIGR